MNNQWLRPLVCLAILIAATTYTSFSQTLHAADPFRARLIPKKGLLLSVHQIPVTTGSEINFFTPDRKHHEYYFTWWEQDADSSMRGRDILFIGSRNTAIGGTFSLKQQGTVASLNIDCKRNDDKSGQADVVYTKLWLPYFTQASWSDSRGPIAYEQLGTFHDTVLYVFSPLGNFCFSNSHPFRLKKEETANPGPEDFTRRNQHLLFYETDITVTKATPLKRSFTVTATIKNSEPTTNSNQRNDTLYVTVPPAVPGLWEPPPPSVPLLLPRPIEASFKAEYYELPLGTSAIDTSSSWSDMAIRLYRELLGYQWQQTRTITPSLLATQDTTLRAEHYRIKVDRQGIRITFADRAGWQYAIYSLAQLTQNRNGKLSVVHCEIQDGPALSFRGIHMFTGPTAWDLHKRMYDRLLLPLKMNKTVLQCEQAAWTSFPDIRNSISVSLQDLQTEFDYLRKKQVEPIPLIQSLGHMEWFFKPTSTRKWAVNPQYPYTLNPMKPAARKAILSIWDEAFSLLAPTTIHVGFDEIGMIGFQLPRKKEIRFFDKQITLLNRYAQNKKAALMIWGDMGLAPGEGPDACNGITPQRARTIRNSIPKGTWVADWHYLGDPDPATYSGSLKLWKSGEHRPLASPWFVPNNIRGFTLAAIQEKAGLLQTTWADFESSERNMLLNIEQFGAYILALDYAWSGRKELPESLPYNGIKEWTRRFYEQAKPLDTHAGVTIGRDIILQNRCTSSGALHPAQTVRILDKPVKAIGYRLDAVTETILPEATPVALLRVYEADRVVLEKVIRYGAEVRAIPDERPYYAHTAGKEERVWYLFFDKTLRIEKIELTEIHPGAGLTVRQLSLIE